MFALWLPTACSYLIMYRFGCRKLWLRVLRFVFSALLLCTDFSMSLGFIANSVCALKVHTLMNTKLHSSPTRVRSTQNMGVMLHLGVCKVIAALATHLSIIYPIQQCLHPTTAQSLRKSICMHVLARTPQAFCFLAALMLELDLLV